MALMPTLTVIYHPNPLRPTSDRELLQVGLLPSDTIYSVISRLGLVGQPLSIGLNGRTVHETDWTQCPVAISDMLVLQQGVAGEAIGAWTAAQISAKTSITLATAATIATVTAFVVNAAIAYAISALAASLSRKSSGATQADDAPTAFSIEGGSNSGRTYEPLILVLGEHRVFPDYACRPFAEFVLDPSTATEVVNNTPAYENKVHPPFSVDTEGVPVAPWTQIGGAGSTIYFGDGQARAYTSSRDGTVTQPHTFVIRYTELPLSAEVATYEDYLTLTATSGNDGGSD